MKLTHQQVNTVIELLDAATEARVAYELLSPEFDSSGSGLQAAMETLGGVLDESYVAFGTLGKLDKSTHVHTKLTTPEEIANAYDAAS